jgi:hypothetical protein
VGYYGLLWAECDVGSLAWVRSVIRHAKASEAGSFENGITPPMIQAHVRQEGQKFILVMNPTIYLKHLILTTIVWKVM